MAIKVFMQLQREALCTRQTSSTQLQHTFKRNINVLISLLQINALWCADRAIRKVAHCGIYESYWFLLL
jgi:hypothetical protein